MGIKRRNQGNWVGDMSLDAVLYALRKNGDDRDVRNAVWRLFALCEYDDIVAALDGVPEAPAILAILDSLDDVVCEDCLGTLTPKQSHRCTEEGKRKAAKLQADFQRNFKL